MTNNNFNPDEHQGFMLLRCDNFIFHNQSLTLEEKILLNLIFSFSVQSKCFFASSDWIAYRFGWSPLFVDEMIAKLKLQGFIKVNPYHVTGRSIWFVLDEWEDPCDACDDALVDIYSEIK